MRSHRDITARLFRGAVLTMLVAELTSAVGTFIDAVITGRFLGSNAVAVYAVVDPYYSIAAMIRCFLMAGCVTLCTRALGRGEKKRAGEVFSLTITAGVILGIALMTVGLLFTPQISMFFGARGNASEVLPNVIAYFRGVFPGAPAFILFVVLIPILQLDGDALRPRIASIGCGVVNVIGDLLNVKVFHGGMFGMGLATAVSQYVALAIMLSHFVKKDSLFRFSIRGIRAEDLPKLAVDGLPNAVSMFCRALLPILLNPWTILLAGSVGLTALSVQHNLNFTIGALGWGIGGAVLMMAGVSAGEQDVRGLVSVAKATFRHILIGVCAITLGVLVAAPLLVRLYLPEAGEASRMATVAVRLYGVALPFLAFNLASANYFQAIERRVNAHLVNIGTEVASIMIPAWILGRIFGINGVWASFPVGQAILSALIVLRARLGRDPKREGLASWLMLKPGFGVPDEDYISGELCGMEDVSAFAEKITDFCLAHQMDEAHANHIALCVEELAGNVIEHGFLPGASNYLDVRVVEKDGDTIIRVRDDCRHFDFKEKAAAFVPDPEHPEQNIGIRIVMRLAKDITYANTMNTNNLTIRL